MEARALLMLTLTTLLDSSAVPHPQTVASVEDDLLPSPHQEAKSCVYPCRCGSAPRCRPGVSVVRDGCGCCPTCARQVSQSCDHSALCDEAQGLVCQYPSQHSTVGVCTAIKGRPCTVYNITYDNGETFMLDCRTQCACKNGTYACASLCPQENISPRGSCSHPRLVDVPGQCCREWMCDPHTVERPPQCATSASQWTECSSICGLGLSHRTTYLNPQCRPRNETRLCQLRPCGRPLGDPPGRGLHHIRKGHECRATQRLWTVVRLTAGGCRSARGYRPRACGGGCLPELSTTVTVPLTCEASEGLADLRPGTDLWRPLVETKELTGDYSVSVQVQWVFKCRCGNKCTAPDREHLHRVHRT